MVQTFPLLRAALMSDALISGAMALLLALAAAPLARLTGLPEPLLRGVGFILIAYALAVGYVGLRAWGSPALVWAVIGVNAAWVIGSIALLLSGLVMPNMLGYAFVILQAAAVGVFAELQYLGLRRETGAGREKPRAV